jgi:endonuclease YncB( thermonuclease family)
MTGSLSPLQPILLTLAIGLIPNSAVALEITDKVVRVLDGDTIEVLHNTRAERIRLNGIDCPEKGQAYGKRAKHAASKLVFGKEVALQTHGRDKYGRTIADVLFSNGTNVNHMLVKDGWCWWHRKYALGDTVLEGLEKEHERTKKTCGSMLSLCRHPIESTPLPAPER